MLELQMQQKKKQKEMEEAEEEQRKESLTDTQMPGYEDVRFEDSSPVPPSPQTADIVMIPPVLQTVPGIDILQEYVDDATISADGVRMILIAWVKQRRCWGVGFAKRMKIKKITPYPALHYAINSFCEERKTRMRCVPFKGGVVDGPQNGVPPPPWAIPVFSSGLFKTEKKVIQVPHTSRVHRCWKCGGAGSRWCPVCFGEAIVICVWCWGWGWNYGDICYGCWGRGFIPCDCCCGAGRVTCQECDGYGNLKTYIELTVKFYSVNDNWIYERTNMPTKIIKEEPGKRIFEQVNYRICPIQGYKVNELNIASYNLVMKQSKLQDTRRVLYQGHNVEVIPVTEVQVAKGSKEQVFKIYGLNRKVYYPNYPKRSCCC